MRSMVVGAIVTKRGCVRRRAPTTTLRGKVRRVTRIGPLPVSGRICEGHHPNRAKAKASRSASAAWPA